MREWLDPRRYNGAVLIGLNGVVVKSHGGTDAEGFAHAVDVAVDMVTHQFNERIREGLALMAPVMNTAIKRPAAEAATPVSSAAGSPGTLPAAAAQ
jgi:glycerol-3-phosphate acyltransferase PlsX